MATSEYEKLVEKEAIPRGRPKLTPEEKAQRKADNRRRSEARRRAQLVLINRYEGEFRTLLENEYKALEGDKRYLV